MHDGNDIPIKINSIRCPLSEDFSCFTLFHLHWFEFDLYMWMRCSLWLDINTQHTLYYIGIRCTKYIAYIKAKFSIH